MVFAKTYICTTLLVYACVYGAESRILDADADGVASIANVPCQNYDFSYNNLTVFVKSSSATYSDRIPAASAAYLDELQRRGASVYVFSGGEQGDPRQLTMELEFGLHGCPMWPTSEHHCARMVDAFFKHMMEHTAGRSLILLIDDDAVVQPDTYAHAMRCLPLNEAMIVGEIQAGVHAWEAIPFACGGPGVTFQASLLPDMMHAVEHSLDRTRADDVLVSGAALAAKAVIVPHPLMVNDKPVGTFLRAHPGSWATYHKVSAAEMRAYAHTRMAASEHHRSSL